MFKIIVCTNNTWSIGKDGGLLYHISEDLKNFKRLTEGNVVIMGYNTLLSLPNQEPLKDRVNIVLTSKEDVTSNKDNLIFLHSIDDVIRTCSRMFKDKDFYVIGGESVYKQFLLTGLVSEIIQTNVIDDTLGDTFFPNIEETGEYKIIFDSGTIFNNPPYVYKIWKHIK